MDDFPLEVREYIFVIEHVCFSFIALRATANGDIFMAFYFYTHHEQCQNELL